MTKPLSTRIVRHNIFPKVNKFTRFNSIFSLLKFILNLLSNITFFVVHCLRVNVLFLLFLIYIYIIFLNFVCGKSFLWPVEVRFFFVWNIRMEQLIEDVCVDAVLFGDVCVDGPTVLIRRIRNVMWPVVLDLHLFGAGRFKE